MSQYLTSRMQFRIPKVHPTLVQVGTGRSILALENQFSVPHSGDMGRLEDAQQHYQIFTETFTNPDPEVAYLLDEARDALREAERRGG